MSGNGCASGQIPAELDLALPQSDTAGAGACAASGISRSNIAMNNLILLPTCSAVKVFVKGRFPLLVGGRAGVSGLSGENPALEFEAIAAKEAPYPLPVVGAFAILRP